MSKLLQINHLCVKFIFWRILIWTQKSRGRISTEDISATRLSLGDPVGFPSHSREWFSIIVYLNRKFSL